MAVCSVWSIQCLDSDVHCGHGFCRGHVDFVQKQGPSSTFRTGHQCQECRGRESYSGHVAAPPQFGPLLRGLIVCALVLVWILFCVGVSHQPWRSTSRAVGFSASLWTVMDSPGSATDWSTRISPSCDANDHQSFDVTDTTFTLAPCSALNAARAFLVLGVMMGIVAFFGLVKRVASVSDSSSAVRAGVMVAMALCGTIALATFDAFAGQSYAVGVSPTSIPALFDGDREAGYNCVLAATIVAYLTAALSLFSGRE